MSNIRLSISDNNVDFVPAELEPNMLGVKLLTQQNWSPSIYKDNHRKESNFELAELIALDFDGGLSLEDAQVRFKDYWHIIGTTKSHQIEKNNTVCDRYRVILKLDRVCTSVASYRATYEELLKWNPEADRATKDAARMFYPCQKIVKHMFVGNFIELVEKVSAPKLEVVKMEKVDNLGTLAKAMNYVANMRPSIQGENGDQTLFICVQKLINDYHLTDEKALELLLEWNKSNLPPWEEKDIRAKIQSGKNYIKPELTASLVVEAKPERTVEEYLAGIKRIEERISKATTIFHPAFLCPITPNSYVLVGALTGEGKTTLLIQCTIHQILQGKNVIFITNEEEEYAIVARLNRTLLKQGRLDSIELIKKHVTIFDSNNTNGKTAYYDTLVEVIEDAYNTPNISLILVDQMITMKKHGKALGTFEGPKVISEYIKKKINSPEECPPILVTQQMKLQAGTPEKRVMKGHTQYCTTTPDDATHNILVARDGDTTFLKICKFRESMLYPKVTISKWVMSPSGRLVPDTAGGK